MTTAGLPGLAAAAAAALIGAHALAGAPAFEFRAVIVSGQVIPGPGGLVVTDPSDGAPRLNGAGRVTVRATLNDGSSAILSDRTGTLELIARTGDPAPGTGTFFFSLPTIKFADTGRIVFRALFNGGDLVDCNNNGFFENDHGIYRDDGEGPVLLLREDGQLPGLKGDVRAALIGNTTMSPFTDSFGTFVSTRSGVCPFFVEDGNVYLLDQGAGLGPFVLPGDPSPLEGATFKNSAQRIRFDPNNPAAVAFTAELEGPGIDEPNDLVFVIDDGEERTIRLRESDPMPGRPGLTIGPGFGSPWMGLRSDVLTWRADLRTDAGEFTFINAILQSREAGTVTVIAVEDETAVGIPGALYTTVGLLDPPFTSNTHALGGGDAGEAAFRAVVSGEGITEDDDEVAYYIDADGGLSILARENDAAPGFAGDVRYATSGFFERTFRPPFVNRSGQVAFRARIEGEGIVGTPSALFLFDPRAATVAKALGPGDPIAVAGDGSDVREVSSVNDFGPTSTAPTESPFNAASEMAFRASFTDGTSAVVVGRSLGVIVPGDLNGDGMVSTQDLLILLAAFGPCPAPPAECRADIDGNGSVGTSDLLILLANWG